MSEMLTELKITVDAKELDELVKKLEKLTVRPIVVTKLYGLQWMTLTAIVAIGLVVLHYVYQLYLTAIMALSQQ